LHNLEGFSGKNVYTYFPLTIKNQSNDSKNYVIHKLQKAFPEEWSMRPMRIAIEKTYNNKKESFKKYYY